MSAHVQKKSYSKLSRGELDAIAAEFDREFVADTFGPLSARGRARHERAKKKRGRPRTGAGSKAVSVTIENKLLSQVDELARRLRVPRSRLAAYGFQLIVRRQKEASKAAPDRPHHRAAAGA